MSNSYLITPSVVSDRLKVLLYGDPGVGKTYFSGTAQDSPSMANVHVLNIDGGIMTLAERGDIMATDIRSVEDLERELALLVSGNDKYAGVKTLVIDNITELQVLSLEGIVQEELRGRLKKDNTVSIDDVYLDDYGKSTHQLARVLRGFRDLPLHVIYVAHKKDKKRKNSDTIEESKPKLTESLCTSIMGYMDFVWYLYSMDVPEDDGNGGSILTPHRYLLTQPYNGFACKTRGVQIAAAIGSVVEDPSFPAIIESIHSSFNK